MEVEILFSRLSVPVIELFLEPHFLGPTLNLTVDPNWLITLNRLNFLELIINISTRHRINSNLLYC